MPLHDAYARLTPVEIAFPDAERLSALASSAAEEAAARGVDAALPDVFASLACVGAFLAELHADDAARVALLEYGLLTFHAMRFHEAGRPLFLLEATAARALVTDAPPAEPTTPARAGYLQLPQHLFWVGAEAGEVPESVDGMFWTVSGDDHLHVMPITGLRPDRPGFGMLTVPEGPLAHAARWMRDSARADGNDYASTVPGAEIAGLYSIETAGEIFKLVARFFGHLVDHPGTREEPKPLGTGSGPAPSSLPYVRVRAAV